MQRAVAGHPISLLFLASSGRAAILDASRQWAEPAPNRPFRYGGAARPVAFTPDMADCVRRITAAVPLVGLNSADFLVRDDASFDLLEINPRPGATFDLYPEHRGALFRLHVAACRGKLPKSAPAFANATAAAIVYAPRKLSVASVPHWPDWTADRPPAGQAIRRGAPFCTVLASAELPGRAERLVRERAGAIIELAGKPA